MLGLIQFPAISKRSSGTGMTPLSTAKASSGCVPFLLPSINPCSVSFLLHSHVLHIFFREYLISLIPSAPRASYFLPARTRYFLSHNLPSSKVASLFFLIFVCLYISFLAVFHPSVPSIHPVE